MFEVHVQSVGVTHHCLYEVMWGEGGGQGRTNPTTLDINKIRYKE